MSFKSLGQVKKEFGISVNAPKEIRKELRRRLKEVHPDTSSGDKASTELESEKALQMTEALTFLDQTKHEKAVVPVEEVNTLVQALMDLAPTSKEKEAESGF